MSRLTHSRFFNRKKEIGLFRQMLDGKTPERLLSFPIEGTMGKSWLVRRFYDLCWEQGVACAYVNFAPSGSAQMPYHHVVDRICDDLGWEAFPGCRACLERDIDSFGFHVAPSGGGGVGIDASDFSGASVGKVVGGNEINVGEMHVNSEEKAAARRMAKQKEDVGRAFRAELAQATAQRRMVVILDAYEHVTEETRAWIEYWLLEPMAVKYGGLVTVIAGRPEIRKHLCRPEATWGHLHRERSRLEPASAADVLDFIRERYSEITDAWIRDGLVDSAQRNEMGFFGMLLDQWERYGGQQPVR